MGGRGLDARPLHCVRGRGSLMISGKGFEMAETDVTGRLARYMAQARERRLAPDVAREARHRILDTLAAMVSGAASQARRDGDPLRALAGRRRGSDRRSPPTSGPRPSTPRSPTRMFAPRRRDRRLPSGDQGPSRLLRRARGARDGRARGALGHGDCSTRSRSATTCAAASCIALGADLRARDPPQRRGHQLHDGRVGAAASLARLDEKGMRHALSYAAQQVSGIWSWVRDAEHVEKAFDFSGMGARNGVTAAIMAQMGFSGVWDVLDGEHNVLMALSTDPKPEEMVAGLGSRFFVDRNRHQALFRRLSDPGAAGRVPQAPSRARADRGQRGEHRREAAGGRRARRQRPRHAGRQLPAHHRGGAGGGRRSPSRTATPTSGWRTRGCAP